MPKYAAYLLPRGMNLWGSSAGKCGEATGLVLRAGGLWPWPTVLCAGNSTASLAKIPRVGARLPTYMQGGDKQLGKGGIISSRSLCPDLKLEVANTVLWAAPACSVLPAWSRGQSQSPPAGWAAPRGN